MVVVNLPKTALGFRVRKRVGQPLLYGMRNYGKALYGLQEPPFCKSQYGNRIYGNFFYNDQYPQWGIFQVAHGRWWRTTYRREFFTPKNPRYVPQQANRQKYADAVLAWQDLSAEQKAVYNERAKYKAYSGYNLCLKEYLLSH